MDFDQVMERITTQKLWDFSGGVHPDGRKELSNQTKIGTLPIPDKLYIPIKQHIGVDAELIVSEGDYVLAGQPLTESHNPFAVPVHASSSGTITKIGEHVSAHPSGNPELTIEITTDKKDAQFSFAPLTDYANCSKDDIIEAICKAGISGMGGAGFPTHVKSNNVKPLEFLIINGIECEPYISADDRLMREHAWQIRQGIDVLVHLLSPKQVLVAVEDNKPEALKTLQLACQQQDNYQVVEIPTKYPAGGEKQLIQVLTSREVPSNGLPIDVGCLMYNVGTCFAIADAVIEGKPLTQRVVTLTGEAIEKPGNYWVKIGTPIKHLLIETGYQSEKQLYPRIIMGGPMMGFTLSSAQVPVIKTTNSILIPAKGELPVVEDERACIRCSACADACPIQLLPQQLFWYSKSKDYEVAQDYNLFDCIECGACAYVCPSEIPLVHYYRKAKSDIRQQKEDKEKAEKARVRFEARKARLEEEKKAREEKHRLAAEARKKAMSSSESGAKDKIAAALARAKAKKAAQANDEQTDASQTNESSSSASTPGNSKNDKVAAAIARAKAKKAAKASADKGEASETDQLPVESDDIVGNSPVGDQPIKNSNDEKTVVPSKSKAGTSKNDKVAAAIARAKAKKAQREAEAKSASENSDSNTVENREQSDDSTSSKNAESADLSSDTVETKADKEAEKKAKIAAAIAKAKAKKAMEKKSKDE